MNRYQVGKPTIGGIPVIDQVGHYGDPVVIAVENPERGIVLSAEMLAQMLNDAFHQGGRTPPWSKLHE